MINQLKDIITGHSKQQRKSGIESVCSQIDLLAKESNFLVICLAPTGSSYLGVFNATKNLFPKQLISLPAYHSQTIFTASDFDTIVSHICSKPIEQVIFGTLPPSLLYFAEQLSKQVKVKMIFHGALSELNAKSALDHFGQFIEFQRKGIISTIGFVKSGLDEWYIKSFNLPAYRVELFPILSDQKPAKSDGFFHVGIFVNDSFNKNKVTQVAAALSIPNTIVHLFRSEHDFEVFGKDRIVEYDPLPHKDFLNLLGSMHVNLHISFSEGMGGQTFTESLSLGVPCLSSHTHQYLKFSDDLSGLLLVDEHENVLRIAQYLENILKVSRDEWKERFDSYNKIVSEEADRLLTAFIAH